MVSFPPTPLRSFFAWRSEFGTAGVKQLQTFEVMSHAATYFLCGFRLRRSAALHGAKLVLQCERNVIGASRLVWVGSFVSFLYRAQIDWAGRSLSFMAEGGVDYSYSNVMASSNQVQHNVSICAGLGKNGCGIKMMTNCCWSWTAREGFGANEGKGWINRQDETL